KNDFVARRGPGGSRTSRRASSGCGALLGHARAVPGARQGEPEGPRVPPGTSTRGGRRPEPLSAPSLSLASDPHEQGHAGDVVVDELELGARRAELADLVPETAKSAVLVVI